MRAGISSDSSGCSVAIRATNRSASVAGRWFRCSLRVRVVVGAVMIPPVVLRRVLLPYLYELAFIGINEGTGWHSEDGTSRPAGVGRGGIHGPSVVSGA